jgi:hypothetical protein
MLLAWSIGVDSFFILRSSDVKLTDFYNEVAKRADTAGTKINAAETKRVLSEAFALLAKLDAADANDTIAKGLAAGKKKIGGK